MVFEHEIPKGSRLYFAKSAKKKRDLENLVSNILHEENFEEIITPSFSYSQHQCLENSKDLIIIFDENNEQVALRADSTLDVVRIITKRLGRATTHKKWFYIQPVFKYPTNEEYQIGVEWINHNNMRDILTLNAKILNSLDIKPLMQISNINIPQLVCDELNIDIELFKEGRADLLLKLNIDWLNRFLYVKNKEDLENCIELLPKAIQEEAHKLLDVANGLEYENIVIAPLYYGSRKYYSDIYYRVIKDNLTICIGGSYKSEGMDSLGFALYTDNLLKILED